MKDLRDYFQRHKVDILWDVTCIVVVFAIFMLILFQLAEVLV